MWAAAMRRLAGCLALCLLAGCAGLPPAAPEVAGKTYVITGASSGIGRGVAVRLGGLGANVVLAARRAELLHEVAGEVTAAGGQALVVPTDVANPQAVLDLARAAAGRFGTVDVWINNAGVGGIGRFEDIPTADHSRIVDVNLKGVIYGSHVALHIFRAQGYGRLINIGSVESEVPLAYHASYAATKAAVLALGRALNEELRLQGRPRVSVSTVLPWATDTPFFEHAANYSGGRPRMAVMDDPRKVVDAIVRISLHPQEELAVGWKGKQAYALHRLAPDLAEYSAAELTHGIQIETAPRAPPTSGSLHVPMQSGRTVDGGVRERMRREEAARRGLEPVP